MYTVNALKVRQAFGKILKELNKRKEPILIEKGRQPAAVLISLDAFQQHFIDYREKEKKDAILELAKKSATPSSLNSLDVLRELRYGTDH